MADSNITKNALAVSMKKLMEKKPFSKISVGDICEDCGMNRKSFYYHFRDKYDLVNWIFYVDFIEGVTENSYSITAVAGYVLLKDGESARDYRALYGYVLDGGRRNSHIVGQITINDMMNADQVIELLNTMMQDIMREFAQKRQ